MAKSLIPTIGLIRSLFSKLAFDASKSKSICELHGIGGTKYMSQRAAEMLNQYLASNKVADLDMAIQLLATVRYMKHGPVEATSKTVARGKDPKGDNSSPVS